MSTTFPYFAGLEIFVHKKCVRAPAPPSTAARPRPPVTGFMRDR